MNELTRKHISTIKDAAEKLAGAKRRAFQAKVALDYLGGNARCAEEIFGWSRQTVTVGLNELRTGIICLGDFSARGDRNFEEKNPQLEQDIRSLAEPDSQVDPKFQSPFLYARITAKAMRKALIEKKGWKHEDLPCRNTIGNIMNRLGFRLKRVQKAKPVKRIKGTDDIFDNVHKENQASDERDDSLRISIDSKAKVDVGEYSRGGQLRGKEAVKALDHDMRSKEKLVPFGILDVLGGLLTIIFGNSCETSDFIVDCLQIWWDLNKNKYSHVRQLVINLDNGPSNSSSRTQFMKRIVEFSDTNKLEVKLIYYPPYYSKYNRIERCWGILELHWNGTLLDAVDTVLEWAKTMTWKGVHPIINFLDKAYEKGVVIAKKMFRTIEQRLERSETLPKYCVTIPYKIV